MSRPTRKSLGPLPDWDDEMNYNKNIKIFDYMDLYEQQYAHANAVGGGPLYTRYEYKYPMEESMVKAPTVDEPKDVSQNLTQDAEKNTIIVP